MREDVASMTGGRVAEDAAGWAVKTALISSGILSAYEFGGLVPVLPHIQEAFASVPGSAVLVRFMISCLGVSMIIGSPISSALAEKFGFRRVLGLALLVYAGAGMVGALLNNLYLLVASRILFGLGGAACGTLLMSMIIAFNERQRNRWLGVLTTIGTISSIVLIPLAGVLGEKSWRYPFLLHVIALPVVLLVMFGIKGDPHALRRAAAAEAALTAPPRAKLRLPIFLIAISVILGMMTCALQLYIPFQLHDMGITDPKQTGLLISTSVITTGITAGLYGWLRNFLSIRGAFMVALLVMGLAYLLTVASPSTPLFVASMLLLGIGVGIAMPNFYALAAVTGPPTDATRNIGMARAGYYSGPLVSQFLLEPVVSISHPYVGVLCTAIIGLLVAVVMTRIRIPRYGA